LAARQSFGLFADTVPLPLAQLRSQGAGSAKHDDALSKLFTFTRDLARRYPRAKLEESLRTPILFDLSGDNQGPMWSHAPAGQVQLAITITRDGSHCRWQFPEQLTGTMRMLSHRLLAYLARARCN
jgi:hypothetical protein